MTGTTTSARAGPHPGETETAAAAATSHLGDPAAVHGGVGFVVAWGQPGPAGQLGGSGEATDVADLGDEHRAQHGPDSGDVLDRPITRIVPQPVVGEPGEHLDLEVQVVDQ